MVAACIRDFNMKPIFIFGSFVAKKSVLMHSLSNGRFSITSHYMSVRYICVYILDIKIRHNVYPFRRRDVDIAETAARIPTNHFSFQDFKIKSFIYYLLFRYFAIAKFIAF